MQHIEPVGDGSDRIIGLRMTNGLVQSMWFKRLSDDFAAGVPPASNQQSRQVLKYETKLGYTLSKAFS